jgi:hypothetical protein
MAGGAVAIFPEALADVARALPKRTGDDALRVLMFLMAVAELENVAGIDVVGIADALALRLWRVDRAIALLSGLHAIRREANGYAISPRIAWMGEPGSERHARAVDAWNVVT